MRAVGLILIALGVAALAAVWSESPARGGEARSVTIGIHFSHYDTRSVEARAGEPIRVTLVNTDPIEHEWLVGDAAFHERHRTGTETQHGARPNEVSLSPGETKTTTVAFDQPGDYLFICHLPGHEQYGMVGVLHVRAS